MMNKIAFVFVLAIAILSLFLIQNTYFLDQNMKTISGLFSSIIFILSIVFVFKG
jgi:hypothetical protein